MGPAVERGRVALLEFLKQDRRVPFLEHDLGHAGRVAIEKLRVALEDLRVADDAGKSGGVEGRGRTSRARKLYGSERRSMPARWPNFTQPESA